MERVKIVLVLWTVLDIERATTNLTTPLPPYDLSTLRCCESTNVVNRDPVIWCIWRLLLAWKFAG